MFSQLEGTLVHHRVQKVSKCRIAEEKLEQHLIEPRAAGLVRFSWCQEEFDLIQNQEGKKRRIQQSSRWFYSAALLKLIKDVRQHAPYTLSNEYHGHSELKIIATESVNMHGAEGGPPVKRASGRCSRNTASRGT